MANEPTAENLKERYAEEVLLAAYGIVDELTFVPEYYYIIVDMIAIGILIERQRCAKRAQEFGGGTRLGANISLAIMAGK